MGAICKYCNQDMREADGCVKMPVKLKDGRRLDPIPYGSESEEYSGGGVNPPDCHDCAAKIGHYHHPDCDWEQCPNCAEQLLTCECWGGESETTS
jgi:hypothetical protein